MSGIAGIINLDGGPVDRELLWRITRSMSCRGPDAQQIWIDGNAGLGHAMLRSTFEAKTEKQPLSVDGDVWLTADARIDGRSELISALAEKLDTPASPNDAELILLAYKAWGEDCVKRLIGDFSFAIWNKREQRLFCARDHFGTKPFFYARLGETLIFSNTLDALRRHPQTSSNLNELAIGDFLLFGSNQDPSTTSFADIARLPPAHLLRWRNNSVQIERYWTLPIVDVVRYRKRSDYIDCFKQLLETAVRDRLRHDRIGVRMSGGLDSSTVAAQAREVLLSQPGAGVLKAFTVVHDRVIPDEERFYAGLVANKLKIPIDFQVADEYQLYQGWDNPAWRMPEPLDHPLGIIHFEEFRRFASYARVVLTGQGGDPALKGSPTYYVRLCRQLRFARLIKDVSLPLFRGQTPPLNIRTNLKRWFSARPWQMPFPEWLHPDFINRTKLQARLDSITNEHVSNPHLRPEAYADVASPLWSNHLEQNDPSTTAVAVEVRNPLFDLRLVNFLLSLPPIPWCMDKEIIRASMKGVLPREVISRPKSPLAGDTVHLLIRNAPPSLKILGETSAAAKYVDATKLKTAFEKSHDDAFMSWVNTRALSLAHWLKKIASGAS